MSEADSNESNPYLACDVFESDEELDEFLADLYRSRRSGMG